MSPGQDVVAYLLGEMGPEETARMERAMREDAGLRAEVARMRPVVAGLDALPPDAWDESVPVPPLPALPPLGDLSARRRRRMALRPAYAVAAAVAVLLAGVAIGALVADRGPAAGPPLALAPVADGGAAHGTARVLAGNGRLRMTVDGLSPSSRRDFYEVWLMDGPKSLISIGSFRVPASGHAEVTMPLPVPVTDFRYIDVSREPEDGIPAHSADSVLRGPTHA